MPIDESNPFATDDVVSNLEKEFGITTVYSHLDKNLMSNGSIAENR